MITADFVLLITQIPVQIPVVKLSHDASERRFAASNLWLNALSHLKGAKDAQER